MNSKPVFQIFTTKHILLRLLFSLLIPIVTLECISCNDKKVTAGQSGSADELAQIDEIKNLERDRLAAGVNKDLNVFKSATADDYMQIDFDGIVLDKAATLQRIKSSYAQLHSNVADDMVVRIYGNTAVLTARANPRGIMKGKEFSDAVRYTRVYVKREGRWQVVLFQQTRIAENK